MLYIHVGFLIVQTGRFEMLSKKPFASPSEETLPFQLYFYTVVCTFFSVEYNSDF